MNKNRKHILFLTTHFPPINVSGVYRIIGFLRYLPKDIYKLTVLTTQNIPQTPIDKDLLKLVPEHIKIIRTSLPQFNFFSKRHNKNDVKTTKEKSTQKINSISLISKVKKHIKGLIFFPDRFWFWIFPILLNTRKKITKPDCIIATAPPFSTLLIGLILSKYWQTPLIVDFRDPWSLNPFNTGSFISKKLQEKMEHYVIKKSKFTIVNTEDALKAYIAKYKKYRNKIICIPNGFDTYKVPNLGKHKEDKDKSKKIHITHCGSLYGFRNPLPLLEALSKFSTDFPFIFSFYGYINPNFLNNFSKNNYLNKFIKIYKPVSYIKSLKIMQSSDLILIYGNCNLKSLQIPRKIYDILNINKPILLIDVKNSPSYRLLNKLKIPFFFSENTCNDIISTLNHILEEKKQRNLYKYNYRPDTIYQFHIKNLTKRLEILLKDI